MSRKLSIGTKLYLSVLSLFLLFAVAFMVFQQYREKQYKIDTLNLKLQDFNNQLHESMPAGGGRVLTDWLDRYLNMRHIREIRVTVINRDGVVVYDNVNRDVRKMGNHARRPEVMQALKNGSGSAVDRNSTTMGKDYFYSATYYESDKYVIRSAMPYNLDLAKSLQTDQHYLWFALVIMLLLIVVLYRFTHRLGNNITKLNEFAAKADHDGEIGTNDLMAFSDDELGDTAERIVKLYLKLQRTQQEQNVLKRQLTQNVAHELKTPVASIQGYLETILENPKVDEGTRQVFLQRCYAQSQRLTSLLADMSMLNRIDDGAQMLSFEDVDLAELIQTVEKESQLLLQQRDMTMTCNMPKTIWVHGNRSLLYSIFRNLADNAIAYAGQGKHITIDVQQHGSMWYFVFSDDGVGVSPEHLPRLFDRFYRVDKGRSRKMGGTGLGLAIVKNAVLVHGGTISVSNGVRGGLCFEFTIRGGNL